MKTYKVAWVKRQDKKRKIVCLVNVEDSKDQIQFMSVSDAMVYGLNGRKGKNFSIKNRTPDQVRKRVGMMFNIKIVE